MRLNFLSASANGVASNWYTTQTKTQTGNKAGHDVEVFASSWVRDLMVARSYADPRFLSEITPEGSRMSGTTDANLGYTPGGHSTHDIGMAMDLGLFEYVDKDPYQLANDAKDLSVLIAAADKKYKDINTAFANAWSNDKAFDLAELLKTLKDGETRNKQSAALKEFFSLYSVTQATVTLDESKKLVRNGSLEAAAQGFVNASDKTAASKALFEGIVLKGYIGETGKNEYKAINDILKLLNIKYRPEIPHSDHFHITFAPPKIRGIDPAPKLLTANNSSSDTLSLPLPLYASLADDNHYAGLMQVAQSAPTSSVKAIVLGSCKYMEAGDVSISNILSPLGSLNFYLRKTQTAVPEYLTDAVVTVTKQPSFGKLIGAVNRYGEMDFTYVANDKKWLGKDSVEFEVGYQGKTYKIIKRIVMVDNADLYNSPSDDKACNPLPRRIAYETSIQTADGGPGFDWDGVNAMLDSAASRLDLSNVMLVFGDLANGAVGQTTSEGVNASITLDSNAAGHGWYIDPTPLDNTDDFLPTSNPNIWQAKAGSAAEGKMDMLSVLLHEYGHALGLEHAADSADFMSATLQSGQRRLPSADELTLMSQLVAQLKASTGLADGSAPQAPDAPNAPLNPSAPLGALLIGRLALGRRPEDEGTNLLGTSQAFSQAASQALFSANPTLQGGSLSTLQDWATQGSVTSNANNTAGATLAESTTSQTRLNQVFMLKPEDRYLSFTLSNLALDDAANGPLAQRGPSDAFEAALINANTGANLLGLGGGIGLSHTDALLNLQAAAGGAGGSTATLAELAAQGVTHVTHPDGSRTYLVDLSGIARDADGTVAVNLSFDLIGFGNTPQSMGSHVQVSGVRLLGLPQAADDSVSYQISNGILASNTATVSAAEDTLVAINLVATDVDSTGASHRWCRHRAPIGTAILGCWHRTRR